MTPKRLLGLCAVLGSVAAASAAVGLLSFAGHGAGNFDDAFILMVYVRNLIEHGTLEWNVGEGRVDGFTSLLDLLVKSAAARLSGAEIFQASLRTTLAFSVLGSWIALAIGYRAGRTPRQRLGLGAAAAGLIASSPANADAAAYVLEGPLFVACALALVAAATATGPPSRLRRIGLVPTGWPARVRRRSSPACSRSASSPTSPGASSTSDPGRRTPTTRRPPPRAGTRSVTGPRTCSRTRPRRSGRRACFRS
jgi:hypothetical protein